MHHRPLGGKLNVHVAVSDSSRQLRYKLQRDMAQHPVITATLERRQQPVTMPAKDDATPCDDKSQQLVTARSTRQRKSISFPHPLSYSDRVTQPEDRQVATPGRTSMARPAMPGTCFAKRLTAFMADLRTSALVSFISASSVATSFASIRADADDADAPV